MSAHKQTYIAITYLYLAFLFLLLNKQKKLEPGDGSNESAAADPLFS